VFQLVFLLELILRQLNRFDQQAVSMADLLSYLLGLDHLLYYLLEVSMVVHPDPHLVLDLDYLDRLDS
jgi:hypothetical protein